VFEILELLERDDLLDVDAVGLPVLDVLTEVVPVLDKRLVIVCVVVELCVILPYSLVVTDTDTEAYDTLLLEVGVRVGTILTVDVENGDAE
jgi:hypothetical protein